MRPNAVAAWIALFGSGVLAACANSALPADMETLYRGHKAALNRGDVAETSRCEMESSPR